MRVWVLSTSSMVASSCARLLAAFSEVFASWSSSLRTRAWSALRMATASFCVARFAVFGVGIDLSSLARLGCWAVVLEGQVDRNPIANLDALERGRREVEFHPSLGRFDVDPALLRVHLR